ncbi:MAG TPA: hypothetical protein VML19_24265 [Verrucomicrobiae bacterium]|nr:hypothetical protein [Verrucomicrobiae bacterium]
MRLVTLSLIAVSACFAATPDLSGDWKLNTTKSEFGQFPAPSSMTQKVSHAEPNLTVETKMASDMGEFAINAKYTTDGKECTNQGFGGSEAKSTVKWDGDALLMETKGSFGDNQYTMKDKWTLSEGGKVLTIQRTFSSGMGDVTQKMVFDKQ